MFTSGINPSNILCILRYATEIKYRRRSRRFRSAAIRVCRVRRFIAPATCMDNRRRNAVGPGEQSPVGRKSTVSFSRCHGPEIF